MALFKRLPKLRWSQPVNAEIVPPDAQAKCPLLADDFKTLDAELLPHFREMDASALRGQNQFRRDQVTIIFGGALATILGALHASLGAATAWIGIVESVLAALLSAVALREKSARAQERYFGDRLKAETLRAEYFLFLGRVGIYADDRGRLAQLVRRVAAIKTGGKQ